MTDFQYLNRFRAFQTSLIWEFLNPYSGRIHAAATREALIADITRYNLNNRHPPIENLPVVLDTYLCKLPQNVGKCSSYEPLERGLMTYIKGGIALVKSLMYDTFVSQSEADRRSDICVKCTYNVFPDRSFFIKWSDSLAKASVGERKAKNFDLLGNCAQCTCCLKAKCWFTGPFDGLTPEQISKMKSVSCWQTEKL
jgi:hypothetical protein